jgi:hypothetical protein
VATSPKKRKIISAAVLLGGLALFLIILNLPGKNGSDSPSASASNGDTYDSGFEYKADQNRNSVTNPEQTADGLSTGDNLTENLADSFSGGIFDANGEISQDQENPQVALPNSDAVGNAISQSLNQTLQFPIFSEKDLRIVSDDSENTRTAYLESLGKVSGENFNGLKTPISSILNEFFEKNDSSKLSKYVAIAENQITDLLALKVPRRFSAWHLQNLNLWEKKLVVYKAILGMNDDPLKAIIAMKEVNNVLQENDNLQKVITDFATQ